MRRLTIIAQIAGMIIKGYTVKEAIREIAQKYGMNVHVVKKLIR